MDRSIEETYEAILRRELVPALGCTEPIAIAYAAATARVTLGAMPDRIVVRCSGNVIKNVKGVVVPTSGDMKGVDCSAVLGIVGGVAELKLEVLSKVVPEHVQRSKELLKTNFCRVELVPDVPGLLIIVEARLGTDTAVVEIRDGHTNIVRIEKNGVSLVIDGNKASNSMSDKVPEYELLSLANIFEYIDSSDISGIVSVLAEQERCNTNIAREGLSKPYGEQVGATLLQCYGEGIGVKAKALAAAGGDARMSGCAMPVIINSGSGNQGITASMPVLAYAQHLSVSEDKKYRALALSNLVSIHIKKGIGKLSAFCGVVSAACGCGAGITYLHGGNLETVSMTITNTLANTPGIICDGAKPSCAAKIASAVDSALLSHCMAMHNNVFKPGEGIVMDDIEATIRSVARIGRDGMRTTDLEILNIMLGN